MADASALKAAGAFVWTGRASLGIARWYPHIGSCADAKQVSSIGATVLVSYVSVNDFSWPAGRPLAGELC
jgi:hypothetical protein